MDRVNEYRQIIKQLLTDYANLGKAEAGIEYQLIFDSEHDHYQLFKVGWTADLFRLCAVALHFDIKDGKIWIQYSGFEADITVELVQRGVPKSDIVIGFFASYRRKLTEYAAA